MSASAGASTVTVLRPGLVRVRAGNSSAMTLTGTNTYLLAGPAADPGRTDGVDRGGAGTSGTSGAGCIVIDPGPDDAGHVAAIVAAAAELGGVQLAVLTHRHPDHSGAVDALVAASGCPVAAVDERYARGGASDRTVPRLPEALPSWLEPVSTPGHTDDSVSLLTADGDLFTGDTVLGQAWTVITHPEGNLGDYFASLDRLTAMLDRITAMLPGHGEPIDDPGGVLQAYVEHRRERLAQVRTAVADGAVTPQQVVEVVYADTDRALWPAAEQSVRAQLAHLAQE